MTSGLLLTLSFPKPALAGLSWICLVPLLWAIADVPAKTAFKIGYVAGLVHFVSMLYWIGYVVRYYGHLSWGLSILLLFLLCAYLALYLAFFSALVAWLAAPPVSVVWVAPVCWVAAEYLRATLFTGFPWDLLGYSQAQHPIICQIADMSGVYGVSGLVVLANAVLFLGCLKVAGKPWQGRRISGKFIIVAFLAGVCFMGAALAYGQWRMTGVQRQALQAPAIPVTVVQGNIDQASKWSPGFQLTTVEKYIALSGGSPTAEPPLIVWPETATPFYLGLNKRLSEKVFQAIRAQGAHFLVGSPSLDSSTGLPRYFNSAFLLDDQAQIQGRYDKVHLVPFGEYVPLQQWLPFIDKMVEQTGDYSVGKKGSTLQLKGHAMGVLICYEAIFPDLSRAAARNGSELLVNITNDAWFGETGAPYQHFYMCVFRAIENRRALVRCANTGISGFISPSGRVLWTLGLSREGSLTQSVPFMNGPPSVYTRLGDFFAIVCLAAVAGIVARKVVGPVNAKS